jgi:hypothetical protein
MRPVLTLLLLALAGCNTAAAAGGEYTCTNAPFKKYPEAGPVGAACAKDGDCQYSVCAKSALQLNGHVTTTEGVCTKNCACGAVSSQCDVDDDSANGLAFTCIKGTSGDTTSECAIKCSSVADCTKVNPRFTVCSASSTRFSTGVKVCAVQ